MSIDKELDQAKNFYRRAVKEDDRREQRRQAREIKHLSGRLAYSMEVRK